tara:strand:- start:39 stop:407 length:369 start_codon:yes stop_codon:yes gene_type:complete
MYFEKINKRKDYLLLKKKGHSVILDCFILQYVLHNYSSNPIKSNENIKLRVGITVSKKIGNAVKRNLVKRRIKASLLKVSQNKFLKYADLIIIGKKKVLSKDFTGLCSDLESAFNKIKLLQS